MQQNGLRHSYISPSKIPGGDEARELLGSKIHALTDKETGDGWVFIADPDNGHAQGSVVWHRAEKVAVKENGHFIREQRKHRLEVLPIDHALLQVPEIFNNTMAEATQLGGHSVNPATAEPGEIERLRNNHRLLGEWYDRTEQEKLDIGTFYAITNAVRARARNPHNVKIAEETELMVELEDSLKRKNPGRTRAKSLVVDQEMVARLYEIINEVMAANSNRHQKLLNWRLTEYRLLDYADEDLAHWDLAGVKSRFFYVRFTAPPFNQLAQEVHANGGELVPEAAERARAGIKLHREHLDRAKPFLKLAAPTIGYLRENYTRYASEQSPEIEARIAKIGALAIGGPHDNLSNNPYDILRDNLLSIAKETLEELKHRSHTSQVHHLAEKFKWLSAYWSFASGDRKQYEAWYGDHLYSQQFLVPNSGRRQR